MHKIFKYYKPFIVTIVIAVIFLFIQAICDLKLPDYMSDIVNIGIQSSGIEQVAPKAISEEGLNLVNTFANEQDKELLKTSYNLIEQNNENYIEEYPIIKDKAIYILNENLTDENIQRLNNIISISCKTVINLSVILQENNVTNSESSSQQSSGGIDIKKMYEFLPMIEFVDEGYITEAYSQAVETSESTLAQVGVAFTKLFYEEVGIEVSDIQFNYILKIGIRMLGVCLIGIIAAIIVGYCGSKTGAGLGRNLRKAVFEKVESFSNTEFNKFSAASLITRTTNDVTQVQNVTIMSIRMLAYAPIMGIGAILMMFQKTTSMVWTIALGVGAIIFLVIVLFLTVFPKFKIIQELSDKLNLVSKENLSGLMVIRAFGTQKHEEERFDNVNKEFTKIQKFINRIMSLLMPYMSLVMNLLCVLIIWAGAKAIEVSSIQVGDLMAVMQYGIQVVISFLMISMIFVMIPRASVSAGRISEVLETENTIKDPEKPSKFNSKKKGYVEFKNVSFAYPGAEESVLENITFTAKPGETTAIIGSTGSGKSTLINLIPRFFDVTKGEVKVNGVDVRKVNQDSLHQQVGYIPQKGNLLSGTIESNLKYGNETATDEFVKKCAKIAQAESFIEEKEEKYNFMISQGAKNVSGGQKQRMSIARALVTNSPIYIFDDSFSALDFKTDISLRKALKENAGDSTFIIVAQRVSTIMNAEQIIVLEEGKIVGIGTHNELLEKCPTYYEIAASQLSEEELKNGRK